MKKSLTSKQVREGLKYGKRYSHNGLSIVCVSRKHTKRKGYAVLISKKTIKNSVTRNRVKRVVREAVKEVSIRCDEFIIIHTNKERDEKGVCEDLVHAAEKISGPIREKGV